MIRVLQQRMGFRKGLAWTAAGLLGVVLILSAAVAFGVSRRDRANLREFAAAVRRWQTNPDFRAVQREYVDLGTRAMQARWCGLSARSIIMAFRSIPGLPPSLAATGSSDAHYDAFSRGKLSAYLHLSSEQGAEDAVPMVGALAKRSPLTDAEVVAGGGDHRTDRRSARGEVIDTATNRNACWRKWTVGCVSATRRCGRRSRRAKRSTKDQLSDMTWRSEYGNRCGALWPTIQTVQV